MAINNRAAIPTRLQRFILSLPLYNDMETYEAGDIVRTHDDSTPPQISVYAARQQVTGTTPDGDSAEWQIIGGHDDEGGPGGGVEIAEFAIGTAYAVGTLLVPPITDFHNWPNDESDVRRDDLYRVITAIEGGGTSDLEQLETDGFVRTVAHQLALSDLLDMNIDYQAGNRNDGLPGNGDVLVYNTATNRWGPSAVATGQAGRYELGFGTLAYTGEAAQLATGVESTFDITGSGSPGDNLLNETILNVNDDVSLGNPPPIITERVDIGPAHNSINYTVPDDQMAPYLRYRVDLDITFQPVGTDAAVTETMSLVDNTLDYNEIYSIATQPPGTSIQTSPIFVWRALDPGDQTFTITSPDPTLPDLTGTFSHVNNGAFGTAFFDNSARLVLDNAEEAGVAGGFASVAVRIRWDDATSEGGRVVALDYSSGDAIGTLNNRYEPTDIGLSDGRPSIINSDDPGGDIYTSAQGQELIFSLSYTPRGGTAATVNLGGYNNTSVPDTFPTGVTSRGEWIVNEFLTTLNGDAGFAAIATAEFVDPDDTTMVSSTPTSALRIRGDAYGLITTNFSVTFSAEAEQPFMDNQTFTTGHTYTVTQEGNIGTQVQVLYTINGGDQHGGFVNIAGSANNVQFTENLAAALNSVFNGTAMLPVGRAASTNGYAPVEENERFLANVPSSGVLRVTSPPATDNDNLPSIDTLTVAVVGDGAATPVIGSETEVILPRVATGDPTSVSILLEHGADSRTVSLNLGSQLETRDVIDRDVLREEIVAAFEEGEAGFIQGVNVAAPAGEDYVVFEGSIGVVLNVTPTVVDPGGVTDPADNMSEDFTNVYALTITNAGLPLTDATITLFGTNFTYTGGSGATAFLDDIVDDYNGIAANGVAIRNGNTVNIWHPSTNTVDALGDQTQDGVSYNLQEIGRRFTWDGELVQEGIPDSIAGWPVAVLADVDGTTQDALDMTNGQVLTWVSEDTDGTIVNEWRLTQKTPVEATPAIVDNAGTPELATGITAAEVRTVLGITTGQTPAILDNAGTPELNTGITAAEVRTVLGITNQAAPAIINNAGTPELGTDVTAEEIRTLIGAGQADQDPAAIRVQSGEPVLDSSITALEVRELLDIDSPIGYLAQLRDVHLPSDFSTAADAVLLPIFQNRTVAGGNIVNWYWYERDGHGQVIFQNLLTDEVTALMGISVGEHVQLTYTDPMDMSETMVEFIISGMSQRSSTSVALNYTIHGDLDPLEALSEQDAAEMSVGRWSFIPAFAQNLTALHVDVADNTNGDVLTWNETAGRWEANAPAIMSVDVTNAGFSADLENGDLRLFDNRYDLHVGNVVSFELNETIGADTVTRELTGRIQTGLHVVQQANFTYDNTSGAFTVTFPSAAIAADFAVNDFLIVKSSGEASNLIGQVSDVTGAVVSALADYYVSDTQEQLLTPTEHVVVFDNFLNADAYQVAELSDISGGVTFNPIGSVVDANVQGSRLRFREGTDPVQIDVESIILTPSVAGTDVSIQAERTGVNPFIHHDASANIWSLSHDGSGDGVQIATLDDVTGGGGGFTLVNDFPDTPTVGDSVRINADFRGYTRGTNTWVRVDGPGSTRIVFAQHQSEGIDTTPVADSTYQQYPNFFIGGGNYGQ